VSPSADPVVIVGGGIAGLAAAYELHLRHVPFVLLERATRLGGVIRTERVGGFTIDGGPDSLLVQKPAAIDLCRALGLGDRLFPTTPPRTAFIVRGGVLHPLPEASVLGIPTRLLPLATTRLFSTRGKLRMAMELALPPRPPSAEREDESIGSFMRRRFGDEAVTYLAEPLFAGIHSGDVERLSMAALFPRLLQAEQRYGSLIRAFRAMRPRGDQQGAFRSLPGGLEEMVTRLVAALPAPALRTGATVDRLDGHGPFEVRLTSGERLSADLVVLAAPAHRVAAIVEPIDAELARLCAGIPYVSSATVALAYAREAIRHPLEGSGFVVPAAEPGWRIMAASWVSSKWPQRAPAGSVLLRAFLGGARKPEILSEDDETLRRVAHDDLSKVLGIRGEPTLALIHRWPLANAQHEVGHRQRLRAVEARLAHLPGLHVTGSGFRGVGIPDCVADGRAVATTVAAAWEAAARRKTPERPT